MVICTIGVRTSIARDLDLPLEQAASDRLLHAYAAQVIGPQLEVRQGALHVWHDSDTIAEWTMDVARACEVDVELVAALDDDYAGCAYQLCIGEHKLTGELQGTGGWERYRPTALGKVSLRPGTYEVRLQPTRLPRGVFANVRGVSMRGIALAPQKHLPPTNVGGPVRVYTTSRFTEARISQQDSLEFTGPPRFQAATIAVDSSQQFQTLEGFGGAFTESSAKVFSQLGEPSQQEVLRAYFDADQGHGYRLCRTHINSCDFSGGNYAYAEVPGDADLEHFTIQRDRQALVPLIHAAQEVAGDEPIKLLASPWSPPAWMKTNGRMTGGGKLKPEYRDAWARYYCRYIDEYAAEGIPIWGLTVQNEPEAVQRWESCIYTAEEERDFVRDHLGPTLHRLGHQDVKLIVWDHNRDRLFDRAATVYDDPEAARYVWGAAFHWYVSDEYHHVGMTRDFYPDKKLLFTEGCLEQGPHMGEWSGGERYAESIVHDLNQGAVGWIDWNLLLNNRGGPNHVGNFCSAPILADTDCDQLIYNSSYYYLGHFSRFIRPGARRVLCENTGTTLESTAFLNTDGSLAIVVLNTKEYPMPVALKIGDRTTSTTVGEHSIVTFVVD